MTERPILFSAPMVRAILDDEKTQTRRIAKSDQGRVLPLRYGEPGCRLWVRETHAVLHDGIVVYRADLSPNDLADENKVRRSARSTGVETLPWRPSIFMQRRHSRITLEVTAVRTERLQDISVDDALHEGVRPPCIRDNFQRLWYSINGDRAGRAWADNPLVWVIRFRRLRP